MTSGVAELVAYHLATNSCSQSLHRIRSYHRLGEVEAWANFGTTKGIAYSSPRGFVAVVHIKTTDAARPTVSPIRLVADYHDSFPTEAEALMSAYIAGQRLIDNALAQ